MDTSTLNAAVRQLTPDSPIGPADIPALESDFHDGGRPAERFAVGAEFETLGLTADTLQRLPYGGERGIQAVLNALATRFGWRPRFEAENLIALERDQATVTIEPGGQVEFSGPPHLRVATLRQEIAEHRRELSEVARALGVCWLWIGLDPLHTLDEIELMPKARYRMMYRYLPTRGRLAPRMMKQTCAVQCSLDYGDEADAAAKLRLAVALSPVICAMTANSPFLEGRPTGYRSYRARIWREVDPDRSGVPSFFIDGRFSFAQYVDFVLDTPMFFVMRQTGQVDLDGVPFRRFLTEGAKGLTPTYGDWLVHTTTVFPLVRVKRHLELRNMDALPPALHCALPALWRGVLYDDEARDAAWRLVAEDNVANLQAAQDKAAREGLSATFRGATLADHAHELLAIAGEGLRRIAAERGEESDASCLEPLVELVAQGLSPADRLIRSYEAAGGGRTGVVSALRQYLML